MSNTNSLPLNHSHAVRNAAVRKLVAEREGSQWCLFLDRDGVVNRQIIGDYVREWRDFEWLPQACPALESLRLWAPHIVVVTNQQGIGKGLMRVDEVENIHRHFLTELAQRGVHIDAIQVCPHLIAADCECRKPKPGLVLDWLKRHPTVNPSRSVVVGDSECDIQLATQIAAQTGGCASIQIGSKITHNITADISFGSLWEFATAVTFARESMNS